MKKVLLNIAALLCAVALFGGSMVYSAGELPVIDTARPMLMDDFLQEKDLSIADLLAETMSSEEETSSETSSEPVSSQEESSKPISSKPVSSKPVSSAPISSKTPSSVPVSSALPPSSVPVSSETPSSEPVSSEEVSSETPPPDVSGNEELLDMLAGAVQREIVGTNTNPSPQYYESYKAQAVACHSYMEYHKARTGSFPTMSYSTPKAKTVELVAEVLNELMYYNGSVINASYHAAAGGHTQSASFVWSGNVPYLAAVESAYDDYDSTSVVAVSEVEQKLMNYGISTSGDPSSWFELASATLTDGGFVDYITICGQQVKGRTLRENILGTATLKSPKIIDIQVSGSDFIFSTKGYGHGAGLSQQGARGYAANEGWDYRTILTHYYTGVTVQ